MVLNVPVISEQSRQRHFDNAGIVQQLQIAAQRPDVGDESVA